MKTEYIYKEMLQQFISTLRFAGYRDVNEVLNAIERALITMTVDTEEEK